MIGPAIPPGNIKRARYIGTNDLLYERLALVSGKPGNFVAQFDEEETGFSLGWWAFFSADFELIDNGGVE